MSKQDIIEAAQAMRRANYTQEEIDEYIRSMSEGDNIPVTTTQTLSTFDIKPKDEGVEKRKEITIGSSLASSLDRPEKPEFLLKEMQTQKALQSAIEARRRGVSEFDLAKGEKKA